MSENLRPKPLKPGLSSSKLWLGLLNLVLVGCLFLPLLEIQPAQAAVVPGGASAKPYDCNSLDYGLYWYSTNNQSKKALAGGTAISGFYDPAKPTIIYVHGWQENSVTSGRITTTNTTNGREEFNYTYKLNGVDTTVNVANAWVSKGWNVGVFHWTQLADDEGAAYKPYYSQAKIYTANYSYKASGVGSVVPVNMRWRKCDGTYSTAGAPTKPAGDLFYEAYKDGLAQYSGSEVRVVGHSLGNQMATVLTKKVYDNALIPANRKPRRVALVDPYWTPYFADAGQNYDYLPIDAATGNRKSPGQVIREYVDALKDKGVIFEWTKTSSVNDLFWGGAGDKNDALIPIIGRTNYYPNFLPNETVTDPSTIRARHVAAPKLYFWSYSFSPGQECWDNSPSGQCIATGRTAHSASNSNTRAQEIMDPDGKLTTNDSGLWEQQTGDTTASPGDDTFRCTTKCPTSTPWGWGSVYTTNGSASSFSSSTPVTATNMGKVREFSAGGTSYQLMVKTDGTVWNLGSGPFNSTPPVQITSLTGVKSVAGGGTFGLALKNDGTVWAWGDNSDGQLGNNTYNSSQNPVRVGSLSGVIAIAAGGKWDYFGLALKSDGTVWAWGDNYYGQLGNNSTIRNSPIPVQVSGLSSVKAISAGGAHSLALKSDGTVWAWGRNDSSQLASTNTFNNTYAATSSYSKTYPASSVPTLINGVSSVIAIQAGGYYNLALKSDGTVWAWGDNYYGQLGRGSFSNTYGTCLCLATPAAVSGLSGVKTISAGGDHSLALKYDGTVWAWGSNYYGNLGNATTTDSNVPVKVILPRSVRLIEASSSSSYAFE